MKTCEHCGAKNATRAQYCSSCGSRFVIVDVEPRAVSRKENAPRRDGASRARAAASQLGTSLWSAFVAASALVARLFARLFAPIFRGFFESIGAALVRALASSKNWDPTRPPNFVYWGLVQFLAFRLPFSVVGLVYATLANAARSENSYEIARSRAESAKNWLLFDFCVGIVVLVLKNLVFASR